MAQYYLVKDGQRLGPFSIEQLVQNGLTPDSLVFAQGMQNWTKAGEVAELATVFAPAPQPEPAPAPAPAPQPAPAPAPQPQYQAPQPQYQAPQYQQPYQPQYQQPYQQPQAMGNYVATPQLGFMEAVKICLQKYFSAKGRARRSEYWWFMLAIYIVNAVINGILYSIMGGLMAKKEALKAAAIESMFNGEGVDTAAINAQDPTTTIIILGILMCIIFVALFIPQVTATARRLHDVGKSGQLQWLYLLCGIGGPICLILCIPEGKPEPNKYGESPKFVLQQ